MMGGPSDAGVVPRAITRLFEAIAAAQDRCASVCVHRD
jgi:hypothetical protein